MDDMFAPFGKLSTKRLRKSELEVAEAGPEKSATELGESSSKTGQSSFLGQWRLVPFKRIADERGSLTPVEGGTDIAFDIARVYYIYDVPSGSERAGHAHLALQQVYLALSGSFDVWLDNGSKIECQTLNRPDMGLYIGPGVWRDIRNFSSGAVCLVLASLPFDEADYLRTYAEFQRYIEGLKGTV